MKFITLLIVLTMVGGGLYYWRITSAAAAENNGRNQKRSRTQKSADDLKEEAQETEKSSKKASSLKMAMPDDDNVKKVIELPPFIVNLADTEQARYLRMTVSLGVDDEEGEKTDTLSMTRVRNALLAVLSEKSSEEILTVEGKAKLRKELLKTAQSASEESGVEAIYITDFIVQL